MILTNSNADLIIVVRDERIAAQWIAGAEDRLRDDFGDEFWMVASLDGEPTSLKPGCYTFSLLNAWAHAYREYTRAGFDYVEFHVAGKDGRERTFVADAETAASAVNRIARHGPVGITARIYKDGLPAVEIATDSVEDVLSVCNRSW